MYKIISNDVAAFVYGRKILMTNPAAHIQFFIEKKPYLQNTSSKFWETAIADIAKNKTRFGRIGLVYDRKNLSAQSFVANLNTNDLDFEPQEQRKNTEAVLKTTRIETQVLVEMANEGLADTVEFRRLARRQLRPLKHANTDTVFFFEDILAEEKTRKILQNIVGGQKKIIFPIDYFSVQTTEETKKRILEIHTDTINEDESFIQKRAESIMKTKLGRQNK